MAASADPVFIRPLAEPENRGAMSMGMAHIGPIVNSEKKKAALRQRAAPVRLCMNRMGVMDSDGTQKAGDNQVAARLVAVAGGHQDAIAEDSADEITQHAGEKYAGGKERGIFQVEFVAVLKELGNPGEIEPKRPAVTEIDKGHRETCGAPAPARAPTIFSFRRARRSAGALAIPRR